MLGSIGAFRGPGILVLMSEDLEAAPRGVGRYCGLRGLFGVGGVFFRAGSYQPYET